MRTTEEMLTQIKEWEKSDLFGTKVGTLIIRLPYEHARQYLKEEAQKEYDSGAKTWEPASQNRDEILI